MSPRPTAKQLHMYVRAGIAMPNGSYWIVDKDDLDNAIHAVGRGNDPHNEIRQHIIKRAKALNLESMIPDNWNADGSLKPPSAAQSAIAAGEAFIEHFGVKGMKWGARRDGRDSGVAGQHSSPDAVRAAKTAATIQKHGIHAVNNADLQHLVQRRNLEQQHAKTTVSASSHSKVATDILKNVAKQQAQQFASQYAAKGVEHVAKHIAGKIAG